ncbi:hypothetical protein [Rhodococcus sp. MEB032]|uniref:hypothetical protein n=1 Tax=Rhodococcus sp. MEB032 TaxID=3040322 RepID=UPI0025511178|nr:hypothetical protein [Rhodococcus sp. MEB032]
MTKTSTQIGSTKISNLWIQAGVPAAQETLLTWESPRPTAQDSVISTSATPPYRVWLVDGLRSTPTPVDSPTVRDGLMRVWYPDTDGGYQTADGRHHSNWQQLHDEFDLVEVR